MGDKKDFLSTPEKERLHLIKTVIKGEGEKQKKKIKPIYIIPEPAKITINIFVYSANFFFQALL